MIRIGTCSWAEKTLIQSGEFYPPAVKTAEARLRYYAEHFDTVEVDSSYYAIPMRSTADLWAMRTPPGFVFHIKVYGALTGHGVNPKTLPQDIRRTLSRDDEKKARVYIKDPGMLRDLSERLHDAVTPLQQDGKLGLMVYQFPPWFHYSKQNLDELLKCRERSPGHRIAVEFRHGSWLTPDRTLEVLGFLRDHEIVYITADEPQFSTLVTVPFVPAATSDTAYYRLHGRNTKNWLKKGVETSMRYDYLYSKEELVSFVPPLRQTEAEVKTVYVMMNNCHGGFAVRNAREMQEIFSSETDSGK